MRGRGDDKGGCLQCASTHLDSTPRLMWRVVTVLVSGWWRCCPTHQKASQSTHFSRHKIREVRGSMCSRQFGSFKGLGFEDRSPVLRQKNCNVDDACCVQRCTDFHTKFQLTSGHCHTFIFPLLFADVVCNCMLNAAAMTWRSEFLVWWPTHPCIATESPSSYRTGTIGHCCLFSASVSRFRSPCFCLRK